MARDLGVSELETQWVSSAYTLAFASGLLFSGQLADTFGKKTLYMTGLAIYAVFAVITGVVKNRVALCVMRAMSGLGLSLASPAGFGIIGVNIRHEPARTRVFAVTGLGIPIGGAFGNLMGGVMANIGRNGWSYRYLFFLLAGLAAVLFVITFLVIPPDAANARQTRRIDWVGGALVTAAICLFTFSLTDSGIASNGWRAPHVPTLLATSILLFGIYVGWAHHLEHRRSYPPIIKLSLFTRCHGYITINCLCSLFMAICIYGWIYTSAIFYQNYKGMTPLGNAVVTLTNTVVGTLSATTVVFLAPRIRTPVLFGVSSLLTATCCLLYALIPEGTIFWAMEFPAQLLQSWGITYAIGVGNILISNLVAQDEQSIGGALFQVSGQVGAALGICLSSLVSSQIENKSGSVLAGVRAGYWFCTANGLMVTLISVVGFRKVRLAKDIGQDIK